MFLLKGRKEINIDIDSTIYLFQKDFKLLQLQEDEAGEVQIDLTDFFEGQTRWKWGVKNKKYAGVFLTAFSFKMPFFKLTVPNLLISIKRKDGYSFINVLVFGRDEDSAFAYASKFKRDNREYIAFEFSNEYREYRMKVSAQELLTLLEMHKEIKEIKQNTEEIKEKTQIIDSNVSNLEKDIEEIKQTIKHLVDDVKQIKENIATGYVYTGNRDSDKVNVYMIKEDGVYSDGEKLYLQVLGSVFDYVDINIDSFANTFGVKDIDAVHIFKLKDLIKKKYVLKEKKITADEVKNIGIQVKKDTEWEISLILKNDKIKQIITLFETYFRSQKTVLEKAFRQAIAKAIELRTELSAELFEEFLPEREKALFDKIKKVAFGTKRREIGSEVYIKASKEISDILLYATILEIERQNKKLEIKL